MRVTSSMMLAYMLKEKGPAGWNSPKVVPSNMINKVSMNRKYQIRCMVGKANNRSGVHGTHLPSTDILDNVEEMEETINKGKKDKEQKRKQVEDSVDSHLKRSTQQPKSAND